MDILMVSQEIDKYFFFKKANFLPMPKTAFPALKLISSPSYGPREISKIHPQKSHFAHKNFFKSICEKSISSHFVRRVERRKMSI